VFGEQQILAKSHLGSEKLDSKGKSNILEEIAEGFGGSLQQFEFGSHSWGEALRGSKIRSQNQPNSLLGFSGFWLRSLRLKPHNFLGGFSALFNQSKFSNAIIFWETQCRLVQQLGSLQLSHFPTWVWSCLSIETSLGAPFHYILYLAFRIIIKWLKSSSFIVFMWVLNEYFVFVFCCIG